MLERRLGNYVLDKGGRLPPFEIAPGQSCAMSLKAKPTSVGMVRDILVLEFSMRMDAHAFSKRRKFSISRFVVAQCGEKDLLKSMVRRLFLVLPRSCALVSTCASSLATFEVVDVVLISLSISLSLSLSLVERMK